MRYPANLFTTNETIYAVECVIALVTAGITYSYCSMSGLHVVDVPTMQHARAMSVVLPILESDKVAG